MISDTHVASISDMHAYSSPLGNNKFKNILARNIVINWLVIWENAVLKTFLVAEKYPLIAELIEINGRAVVIIYNGNFVILFLKQTLTIKLELISSNIDAKIPKQKLSIKHSNIAFFEPLKFPFAFSSDTILVAVRLIPDVAIVIKKENTDIINVNKPIPSAPILLDIYTLKKIDILCITIDVRVNITVFIINNFALLKKTPPKKIYD